MTFGEFKELNLPDFMPMENALSQALFDKKIDVLEVLTAYIRTLEYERHKMTSQFEEACVCLNMHLSKHWNKKADREKLDKRMLHIYNKTKTLIPHVYDKDYNYTEEDDKTQEENYNMHYFGLMGQMRGL